MPGKKVDLRLDRKGQHNTHYDSEKLELQQFSLVSQLYREDKVIQNAVA